uniref:Dual specificity phosphatase 15 n=1 Tax=Gopherus evgoodei TaxID=1825980 RepID=A0A8C4W7D1_9SAUR
MCACLFVCRGVADAKDLEQLSRNKITHIISIHDSPQPLLQTF